MLFLKKAPIGKYVKRLLVLDLSWTIIEIPIIVNNYFILSDDSLLLSCINLLKGFLWGETYLGSWFIHASWMGMLIVNYVFKVPKWLQFMICILCFVMALVDTSYYFFIVDIGMKGVWESLNRVIYPSESFIVAIPYLLVGKYIADNKETDISKYSTPILLLSVVMLLVQAEFCRLCSIPILADMANPRYEVFILLPIIALLLVKISINYKMPISNKASKYLRNMSILIYLFHRISLIFIHKLGIEPEGYYISL